MVAGAPARRLDFAAASDDASAMTPRSPSENDPPEMSARDLASRVARIYMAPRWKGLTVALLAAVVVAWLSAKLVQVLQPAVDVLLGRHDAHAMLMIPVSIVLMALGRTVAQVIQASLVNRIGNGVVADIQRQLFGQLVRADLAHLRAQHSGAFVSSVLYDAGLTREAATSGLINYTQNVLVVVGGLWVMFKVDWSMSILVLVGAPIASWIMQRFSRRTTKAAKGAMAETSALSTAIMESLDGIRVVKIDNREAFEEGRVAEVIRRRERHLIKGSNARAWAAPITELSTSWIMAGVFLYAGWRGGITPGSFTEFIGAFMMTAQSLRQLANLQTVFAEGQSAARRLFGALDVEPEVRETPGAPSLPRSQGLIRLEQVSFSYGGDGPPTLERIDFEVRRGETVALVGPSGGGKTTILNLIPRFYDPTGGCVRVDGRDVREVTLASLRDQIALVTQEPFLFDDTIRANIAYARPDASRQEIEAAAKAAAAHDFIVELSDGYDTSVGEAGARLSGGQRQRIAIARAFLKDAPILLLDEATSALDTESEAQVQAALRRLMAGRTTILIAHRLSTVRGADRIYVIDRGQIVETGDHAGLLKKRGLYARLAKSQDLEAETAA